MKQQDVVRIAQRAPSLKQLVVLSMPDALLVDEWSVISSDAETVAALMGSVLQMARQLGQAAVGRATSDFLSIELTDALIIVAPVGPELAAGFVYDRGATLGLARVQTRDMIFELSAILRGTSPAAKPPAAVPLPTPAASEAPMRRPPPAMTRASATTDRAALTPPEPARAVSATADPASTHSTTAGRGTGSSNVDPASRPTVVSRPTPVPEPQSRPRAVRLLEFLHRYAPDPHVSLLRLSLRTGIALEKLDRPELLTHEQVESMAASVRDIIGQEQLGI